MGEIAIDIICPGFLQGERGIIRGSAAGTDIIDDQNIFAVNDFRIFNFQAEDFSGIEIALFTAGAARVSERIADAGIPLFCAGVRIIENQIGIGDPLGDMPYEAVCYAHADISNQL